MSYYMEKWYLEGSNPSFSTSYKLFYKHIKSMQMNTVGTLVILVIAIIIYCMLNYHTVSKLKDRITQLEKVNDTQKLDLPD